MGGRSGEITANRHLSLIPRGMICTAFHDARAALIKPADQVRWRSYCDGGFSSRFCSSSRAFSAGVSGDSPRLGPLGRVHCWLRSRVRTWWTVGPLLSCLLLLSLLRLKLRCLLLRGSLLCRLLSANLIGLLLSRLLPALSACC